MNKILVHIATLLAAGMAGSGCSHHSGLHGVPGATDAACEVGAAAGCDGEVGAGPPDAGADSTGRELDSAVDAATIGNCITADDCLAVLNYRTGFECWWGSGASKADVSGDHCLVPWKPDPRCTTSAPPTGCPSGLLPVNHSCLSTPCETPVCTEGKCLVKFGQCDTADAGAVPIDCEELRATYLNAFAAAQQCDPGHSPSSCAGTQLDACGCQAPYDRYGLCADAVSSTFTDWQNANCPIVFDSCEEPCVAPSSAGATCVPNATGSAGTCAWK